MVLGTGKPFSFQISDMFYCPATSFYSSPPHLLLRLPPCTSLHTVEFKGHAIIVLKWGSFGTRLVPKFTVLLLLCVGFCGLYNIPHSLQITQYKLICPRPLRSAASSALPQDKNHFRGLSSKMLWVQVPQVELLSFLSTCYLSSTSFYLSSTPFCAPVFIQLCLVWFRE